MTASAPQRYSQGYNCLEGTTQMANYELDEIHRIRREISARFDHDASKLGEYYRALDEEFRKAGYKFADLPPEKPKIPKPADKKATD